VLKGDVVKEVSKLRQKPGGDIVVHGSPTLAKTLIENDLVDELRLMVFPVLLGSGRRLFGETSDMKRLRLTSSQTVGDGVLILIYQPAGKETTERSHLSGYSQFCYANVKAPTLAASEVAPASGVRRRESLGALASRPGGSHG
jgi:hypothetical protein